MEKYKKDIEYKKWRNVNCTKVMFDVYLYDHVQYDDYILYRKYKRMIA